MDMRASGVGPWIYNTSRGGSPDLRYGWRYRRRGGGFFQSAKRRIGRAWATFKKKFVPVAKRHAKTFLNMVFGHARENAGDYYKAYKEDGLKGMTSAFVNNLPSIGTQFLRTVINPERGGANSICDHFCDMVHECKPELMRALQVRLNGQLTSEEMAALADLQQGTYRPYRSERAYLMPIQLAHQAVARVVAEQMSPEERRGGFFPFLIPIIASIAGAAVSSIPNIVRAARGSGIQMPAPIGAGQDLLSQLVFPPFMQPAKGRGPTKRTAVSMCEVDGQPPVKMSRAFSAETPCKVQMKITGGKGRPFQRTYYVPNNSFV